MATVMNANTGSSSHSLRPIRARVRNRPRQMSEISARPGCMLGKFHSRPLPLVVNRSAAARSTMPASRHPTKLGSFKGDRAVNCVMPCPSIRAQLSQKTASKAPW